MTTGTNAKLEKRVVAALSDGSASSNDLMELIAEARAAAEAAQQAAAAERDRALDVTATADVGAASAAVVAAELYRDRLQAVVPRLRQRLTEALGAEAHSRWLADYQRVAQRRDAAAAKFAEACPRLLAELVALFREADAVDQECSRVNSTAPAAEPRLVGVELSARRMDGYTATQPSLSATVRLPDYAHSDTMAWPVLRPNDFAVSFAESMRPPHDIRFTSEWWRAAEQDRIERLQIAERRAAEQHAADAARRADYERGLLKLEEESERRAHEARRRG
jgi:hypothetical protein